MLTQLRSEIQLLREKAAKLRAYQDSFDSKILIGEEPRRVQKSFNSVSSCSLPILVFFLEWYRVSMDMNRRKREFIKRIVGKCNQELLESKRLAFVSLKPEKSKFLTVEKSQVLVVSESIEKTLPMKTEEPKDQLKFVKVLLRLVAKIQQVSVSSLLQHRLMCKHKEDSTKRIYRFFSRYLNREITENYQSFSGKMQNLKRRDKFLISRQTASNQNLLRIFFTALRNTYQHRRSASLHFTQILSNSLNRWLLASQKSTEIFSIKKRFLTRSLFTCLENAHTKIKHSCLTRLIELNATASLLGERNRIQGTRMLARCFRTLDKKKLSAAMMAFKLNILAKDNTELVKYLDRPKRVIGTQTKQLMVEVSELDAFAEIVKRLDETLKRKDLEILDLRKKLENTKTNVRELISRSLDIQRFGSMGG
jgi:hypothetical protein